MTEAGSSRGLLVVEDQERVANFLVRGLRAEGYAVTHCSNGVDALEAAMAGGFAAILLDLMLPRLSGQDVCQRLRAAGNMTPILMLTALDGVEQRVEGLRLGADDYLTKPFAFEELVARVSALIRRDRGFRDDGPALVAGDIVFDRVRMVVARGGSVIELTAKELALLEFLMSHPGRMLSRTRILSNVWGYAEDPLTNVVDVYVRRLRKKLGDLDADLIVTVRGFGYRFDSAGGSRRDHREPCRS